MRHLLLLASVLTACTNENEPIECDLEGLSDDGRDFELCSSETPDGLVYSTTPVTGTMLGPANVRVGLPGIALGGTMDVMVAWDDGRAFDLPYRVETAGHVQVAGNEGAALTLTGVAEDVEWLALLEAGSDIVFDLKNFEVAPIERISLVSGTNEATEVFTPVAFTPQTRRIGIALWGGILRDRLVDVAMAIDAPGSQRLAWDIIELAPNASTVTVTAAGGAPETLTVTTATADRIESFQSTEGGHYAGAPVRVCFGAFAGTTQVLGHAWVLTVDGEVHTPDGEQNCTSFVREFQGAVTITASAGGLTTSKEVYVDPSDRGRTL